MKSLFIFSLLLLSTNLFSKENLKNENSEEFLKVYKPFTELDDVTNLCKCLNEKEKIEIGEPQISLLIKDINYKNIKKLFSTASSDKKCLDIDQNGLVDKYDYLAAKSLINNLADPKMGISCKKVKKLNQTIANDLMTPTCRSFHNTISAVHEVPNTGESAVGAGVGTKGVIGHALSDIFKQDGNGFVEFRKLKFTEKASNAWIGGFITTFSNLIISRLDDNSELVSNTFESYKPIPSTNMSGNVGGNPYVYSNLTFKSCVDMNDPGYLIKAYCELDNMNGVVYSEAIDDHQTAGASYGNAGCI